MRRIASLAWFLLVVLGGCVDLPGEDVEEATTVQYARACTGDDCPTNSSVVDTYPFHELSLDPNVTNNQGFSIAKLKQGATSYVMEVVNGEIIGRLGNTTIRGQALQGAEILLTRQNRDYFIRITEVRLINMKARLDPALPAVKITGYRLDWRKLLENGGYSEWENVCKKAILPDGTPDLYGAPGHVAFVFEGERISSKKKEIWAIDNTWFNVGCAGHALAKMYQHGHVAAAAVNGFVTTVAQRQTMLKMFTADYCGTGYSFTVPGILLDRKDDLGWIPYTLPAAAGLKVEARWKASGATCLNIPRVEANATPDSKLDFPDVELAIKQHCTRPQQCTNNDINDLDGYHLISSTP